MTEYKNFIQAINLGIIPEQDVLANYLEIIPHNNKLVREKVKWQIW
jgi:hypothetical protein